MLDKYFSTNFKEFSVDNIKSRLEKFSKWMKELVTCKTL